MLKRMTIALLAQRIVPPCSSSSVLVTQRCVVKGREWSVGRKFSPAGDVVVEGRRRVHCLREGLADVMRVQEAMKEEQPVVETIDGDAEVEASKSKVRFVSFIYVCVCVCVCVFSYVNWGFALICLCRGN